VEPKKAVWLWLQSQQRNKGITMVTGKRVLAESWWLTKPLEYLAGGSGIQVFDLQGSERLLSSLRPGEAVVVFSGSESHRWVQEHLRQPYRRQDFATPLQSSFLVAYLITE
jgi:hypothetical protein